MTYGSNSEIEIMNYGSNSEIQTMTYASKSRIADNDLTQSYAAKTGGSMSG
jgi:hypothetical protein